MQTEIVTTPGDLAGMPGIPRHVRDWAFKRGERVCWLTLTDTGINCCLRSGALSLEFDTTDSVRAVSVRRAIASITGRDEPLTEIPAPDLTLEPIA